MTDHYYEFYRASPRRGFDLRIDSNFAKNDWLSDVSACLVKARFESLWNIGNYDPPILVVGVRGVLGTTFTDENVINSTVLPTDFRQFLGGSSDIRGFSQRELPGGLQAAGRKTSRRTDRIVSGSGDATRGCSSLGHTTFCVFGWRRLQP